jgi:hypothetical protein
MEAAGDVKAALTVAQGFQQLTITGKVPQGYGQHATRLELPLLGPPQA